MDTINRYTEEIKDTLQGIGSDKNALTNISVKISHKERMKIRQAYKSMYGEDFMDVLKSYFKGNYRKMILALYTDPIEYDVDLIYKAIKGAGTDEDVLIEIFASRPGWFINKIKKKYQEKYNKDLEKDVEGDTSGNFRKLLISLLQCKRSNNENPDQNECEKIAQELYKAGEAKLGTDEPVFNKIFALSSPEELMMISRAYHKSTGHLISEAIDSEFSGDIKKLLKTILYAQISPSEYFATRIHEAVSGLISNKKLLIRILVTRNEIDLPKIKEYYKKLYKKDMITDVVKGKPSNQFQQLLSEIINKS